jgi:hypothetical protein
VNQEKKIAKIISSWKSKILYIEDDSVGKSDILMDVVSSESFFRTVDWYKEEAQIQAILRCKDGFVVIFKERLT